MVWVFPLGWDAVWADKVGRQAKPAQLPVTLPSQRHTNRASACRSYAAPSSFRAVVGYLCVNHYAFWCEVAVNELCRLVKELQALGDLGESLLNLNFVQLELVRLRPPARRRRRFG